MLPHLYDGSGLPPVERIPLCAGKLTMEYEAGTLRYIRLGDEEIVRAVYAAVRDHNWGTIPVLLRDVNLDMRADSFTLRFTSDHQQGDIHFVWSGTIIGTADSTLTFTFDGAARTTFRRNRVGFCVLHPMAVAGKPLVIEHTDGVKEQGKFPQHIAPHQPFFDIRAITHEVTPALHAEVRMVGDTFEMEDQRNWTDASFKTYCTPLALPYPVLLEAGTAVRQSVTLRLLGDASHIKIQESAPTLHLNTAETVPLPPIGFAVASHGEPLTAREIKRLAALNLSHLRVDVRLNADGAARLFQAWMEAQAIGAVLEIAVHLSSDNPHAELLHLRDLCREIGVRGWLLVLRADELATRRETIDMALRIFEDYGADLLIGAGTNGYFTQLNRNRPDHDLLTRQARKLSLLAYSVNPQVHAFDNASLIETLPALCETVKATRQFAPVDKLAVTPVTFKIRWNPDATATDPPTPHGRLPRQVDPRQMSLFGAGWTLGALAALVLAGVNSLTFFETTGWLGVMERESGSPLPDLFPSVPGGVYPLYHVFADVGEFAEMSQSLAFTDAHPLETSGLALSAGNKLRLLIANHTPKRQSLTVTGVGGTFELKSLDETTANWAIRDPQSYRAAAGQRVHADDHGLRVELLPYALVRLDRDTTL